MTHCHRCGATAGLISGFNACMCGACLSRVRQRHRALNGNVLMTDMEVWIYASPGQLRAHEIAIGIWALDDAGDQWHLTWMPTGAPWQPEEVVEGAWQTIRAWVTQRLQAAGLTHLQPKRHRADDAEAHDASAAAIVLLRRGATAAQLRRLARYTGPSAQEVQLA